jgi:translation initiation factor 1
LPEVSKKKERLPTASVEEFGSNPFGGLVSEGLNSLPTNPSSTASPKVKVSSSDKLGKGERLEVRREKSGRGGKTVTTIKGFPSRISQDDFKRMLKGLKSRLGTGGGWRDNQMEIQGDQREVICEWLSALGFRPVLAGG